MKGRPDGYILVIRPGARIEDDTGNVTAWRSKAFPRYQRLTKKAEALIAAVYLAGTNTRRVKRALFGLFEGAVSKDAISRAWRKVKVQERLSAPSRPTLKAATGAVAQSPKTRASPVGSERVRRYPPPRSSRSTLVGSGSPLSAANCYSERSRCDHYYRTIC
jgi:hypothetical protein